MVSAQRQERKDKQARHENPINFTCGFCKQVHPFVDDKYLCPDDISNEEVI